MLIARRSMTRKCFFSSDSHLWGRLLYCRMMLGAAVIDSSSIIARQPLAAISMKSIYRLLWPPARTRLGPLEEQLLRELWRRKNATVRELMDDTKTNLAYTTVMTTLDRLYKKRLLDRVAEGKAFRYSPRYTLQELEKAAAGETIRQLLQSSPSSALPLSYLVEAVSDHDVRLLDDLQQLVDEKRSELREKEER